MPNTPQQAISDGVQALPYEVFEIRTLAFIGGMKLPVVYLGVVQTGGIQQAVAALQHDDPLCDVVLRHCLAAAPSYSVHSMGWAPDRQGAKDLQRRLIAEHQLVLNEQEASGQDNSIYEHYLREHGLEQQETAPASKPPRKTSVKSLECAGCGDRKERTEFYQPIKKNDPICKECKKDSVARKVAPCEYVRLKRDKLPLPPICPLDISKECIKCGKIKATDGNFDTNVLIHGGYNTTCRACLKKRKRPRSRKS